MQEDLLMLHMKYAGARCSKSLAGESVRVGKEVAHCGGGGAGGLWKLR